MKATLHILCPQSGQTLFFRVVEVDNGGLMTQGPFPHGDQARFAVNGGALPRLGRLPAQDADQVPTQGGEESELLGQVQRLIVRPLGIGSLIDAHQKRAFQRQGPLDAIGEVNLGVGQVTDDLLGAPLAGDGAGTEPGDIAGCS
jgi:hypothetical protein